LPSPDLGQLSDLGLKPPKNREENQKIRTTLKWFLHNKSFV
jgi:hypothetical protein